MKEHKNNLSFGGHYQYIDACKEALADTLAMVEYLFDAREPILHSLDELAVKYPSGGWGATGAIKVNSVSMGDNGSIGQHAFAQFVYSQATYNTQVCAATASQPVVAVPRAVYNLYLHFTNNQLMWAVVQPAILPPPSPALPALQQPQGNVQGGGRGHGGGGGGEGRWSWQRRWPRWRSWQRWQWSWWSWWWQRQSWWQWRSSSK